MKNSVRKKLLQQVNQAFGQDLSKVELQARDHLVSKIKTNKITYKDARELIRGKAVFVEDFREKECLKTAEIRPKRSATKTEKYKKKAEPHLQRIKSKLSEYNFELNDPWAAIKNANPFTVYTAIINSEALSWQRILSYFLGGTLLVNTVVNLASNYFYERNLSVTTLKEKQKEQLKNQAREAALNNKLDSIEKHIDALEQKGNAKDGTKALSGCVAPSSKYEKVKNGPYGPILPKGETLESLFAEKRLFAGCRGDGFYISPSRPNKKSSRLEHLVH